MWKHFKAQHALKRNTIKEMTSFTTQSFKGRFTKVFLKTVGKIPEISQVSSNTGGCCPLNIISSWGDSTISWKGTEPLGMCQNQNLRFLNLQHFQRQLLFETCSLNIKKIASCNSVRFSLLLVYCTDLPWSPRWGLLVNLLWKSRMGQWTANWLYSRGQALCRVLGRGGSDQWSIINLSSSPQNRSISVDSLAS